MPTTYPTAARPLKLSEMGTAGLLQWIAAGESAARAKSDASGGWGLRTVQSVYRLRTGQATKVILARYGEEAAAIFRQVAAREHAARESVARLAAGGCIACRRTVSDSAAAELSIRELCRRAGVDYAAAVDCARADVYNRPNDASSDNARAFLAAI